MSTHHPVPPWADIFQVINSSSQAPTDKNTELAAGMLWVWSPPSHTYFPQWTLIIKKEEWWPDRVASVACVGWGCPAAGAWSPGCPWPLISAKTPHVEDLLREDIICKKLFKDGVLLLWYLDSQDRDIQERKTLNEKPVENRSPKCLQ